MELADYLRVLRAHWLGVLVFAMLGVAAAGAYTLAQPEVYAANAAGFVTSGAGTDPALASINDSVSKSRAKSYVDLASSRATAERVINELGLDETPAGLIGSITVEQPLDTVSIKITAQAPSPEQAQQLADAWVLALAAEVAEIESAPGAEVSATRVEPVESAALPTQPVSPKPLLNLAIGLAVGLLLGLAYALVRHRLDRRLRSAVDVEREFGVAVVGSIPDSPELGHQSSETSTIVVGSSIDAPSVPSAEAFRKLRTNLSYMDVDNPPRTIVVTSPQQDDGKSTVAANLAAAIAAGGQRVTLVDGDLRRPTVATSFELLEGAGLTDILTGRAALEDVIQQHPTFPMLSVLSAGSIPPNPSELLGSQAMKNLLTRLAADGMVIVDAPPLLPVTDAAVLANQADGAVVTIYTGKTLDTELAAALDHLQNVHARVLGIVFNRVPKRSAGGYYGYYQYTAQPKKAASKSTSKRKSKAHAR